MYSSNDDQPSDSRPRQLVFDAAEHCYRWHEVCLKIHQGTIEEDISRERARREFHNAVMQYWKIMEWFRDHSQATDLWDEQVTDSKYSLADLGDLRFETHQTTEWSNDENQSVEREEPFSLPIETSARMVSQLDKVAHTLGFSPRTKNPRANPSEATV